jgi:hypothetical protein
MRGSARVTVLGLLVLALAAQAKDEFRIVEQLSEAPKELVKEGDKDQAYSLALDIQKKEGGEWVSWLKPPPFTGVVGRPTNLQFMKGETVYTLHVDVKALTPATYSIKFGESAKVEPEEKTEPKDGKDSEEKPDPKESKGDKEDKEKKPKRKKKGDDDEAALGDKNDKGDKGDKGGVKVETNVPDPEAREAGQKDGEKPADDQPEAGGPGVSEPPAPKLPNAPPVIEKLLVEKEVKP